MKKAAHIAGLDIRSALIRLIVAEPLTFCLTVFKLSVFVSIYPPQDTEKSIVHPCNKHNLFIAFDLS